MIIFAGFIISKAIKIQFSEGEHWRALGDSLTTDYRIIPAARGNIYAADGSMLATSVPVFDVAMDTRAEGLIKEIWDKNIDSLSFMLSKLFKDKSEKNYYTILQKARRMKDRYLPLQRKISYDELKQIKKFPIFRLGRNKGGLLVDDHEIRETPFGNLAFRTIGYQRDTLTGVGIEAGYNKELTGHPGKRLMQKIVGGHWVPLNDDNEVDPFDGYDLYTTIDVNMQDITEHALAENIRKHGASHGCAIVMETKTGAIKAIANLTRKNNDSLDEDQNYAINEITEPGSTFKLASVLALLEDNLVSENETVNTGNGTLTVANGVTISEAEDGGHGILTLKQCFELSSNVGIASFVRQKYSGHATRFVNHIINDFKLGSKTGIKIPGEGTPKIKTPNSKTSYWSEATLPEMAIGYEVMITPLQILTLYNAVANNGKMMKPMLVKKISSTGNIVKEFSPEVLNERICSETTIKKVLSMMKGVVEHGTAMNLKNNVYTIAGKTGTAKLVENKKYVDKYKSSFCGFFPAENPMYTIMVIIFKPSNGVYYGAKVAGPVFKEIADKIYALNGKQNENKEKNIVKISEEKYIVDAEDVKNIGTIIPVKNYPGNKNSHVKISVNYGKFSSLPAIEQAGVMPDLTGMKMKDAVYILDNMGVKSEVEGNGKVVWQSIPKNEKIFKGISLKIKLI